ncbi:adenylate/guanylate cyclase domain-containing protein [Agromyces sp. SYSU T0242]|uniref:adenylate/guanylate cyclase domain-containing protein n=1 Tax=Agromyces litoreus TaxID=3158561 RepID=UPI0033953FA1
MRWFSREEAAERGGVEGSYLDRLVALGIIVPERPGSFSSADVRRVLLARSLEDAAVPLGRLGAALEQGAITLDFLDSDTYGRFATLMGETFRQAADRTGIPIELLTTVREAIGSPPPDPDEPMRDDESAVVPFIAVQVEAGFRPSAIERLLRVYGESTRRMAEAEADWWNTEVITPAMRAGKSAEEISDPAFSELSTPLAQQAVLGMYHAQQARAWMGSIIETFEMLLANAGIHSHLERPPAICFLDITGYTRLTQERGDEAAADLAATLARLVQRGSVRHGGKPVKWLGDGVMFHFRDPGPAVRAGLEMVEELSAAGLPPAHVGLHSGPVLFQQGDYFGQTVNLASRIADYARPNEVLVTQAIADSGDGDGIVFRDVGPAELKGVTGPMRLFRAEFA